MRLAHYCRNLTNLLTCLHLVSLTDRRVLNLTIRRVITTVLYKDALAVAGGYHYVGDDSVKHSLDVASFFTGNVDSVVERDNLSSLLLYAP